jgi:hypothetical protein
MGFQPVFLQQMDGADTVDRDERRRIIEPRPGASGYDENVRKTDTLLY